MKTLELTQGKVALVDDDVFEWASQYKWHALIKARRCYYAVRSSSQKLGKRRTLYLHREIMEPADGEQIDHISGDGLDNRRENLRMCSPQQNRQAFRQRPVGATSKFRGVCWFRTAQKWKAAITLNGNSQHLGLFVSEEDAAHAYDCAAWKFFGKFAQFNFPRPWLKTTNLVE